MLSVMRNRFSDCRHQNRHTESQGSCYLIIAVIIHGATQGCMYLTLDGEIEEQRLHSFIQQGYNVANKDQQMNEQTKTNNQTI